MSIGAAQQRVQEIARFRTEMLVSKRGQRFTKRQPVTAILSACPLRVHYPLQVRDRRVSPRGEQTVWEVQLLGLEAVRTLVALGCC